MAAADFSDTMQAQQQMEAMRLRLEQMADDVGKSRQVVEYNSEMRKMALARTMKLFLTNKMAYNAAESLARADAQYATEVARLQQDYETAESVLAQWEATKCAFESARSILAMRRTQVGML